MQVEVDGVFFWTSKLSSDKGISIANVGGDEILAAIPGGVELTQQGDLVDAMRDLLQPELDLPHNVAALGWQHVPMGVQPYSDGAVLILQQEPKGDGHSIASLQVDNVKGLCLQIGRRLYAARCELRGVGKGWTVQVVQPLDEKGEMQLKILVK